MITIQSGIFAYEIAENAENRAFLDLRDGRNYLSDEPSVASYLTLHDGTVVPVIRAAREGNLLRYTYADGNAAEVSLLFRGEYIIFTLDRVERDDFLKIAFVNIPVSVDYSSYVASDEAAGKFTATLMGLTCATRMAEHPGRNLLLRAEGYPKIGLSGTRGHTDRPVRAAIFGAPDGKTRDVMKTVMDEIPDGELPKSKKGGAWGAECADARRTYTTIFSDLPPEAIGDKIKELQKYGITQVSYHQGWGCVQGDFALDPEYLPNGKADLHYIVDSLHAAGIQVCLHPYTYFIGHKSRYLGPIPHPDLDAICRLTLAEDVDENATEIKFIEPPDAVAKVYSGELVSSASLQIGNEIVEFTSVREEPPYAFLGCRRGTHRTTAARHRAGEGIKQLKEYFQYFLPKADSELFYEVAKNTADFYNEFGFDGFYMDAMDGGFAMEGNEYVWYYAVEFITEVLNRLNNDPVFDCCYNPQYTGSFYARSRYGALDHGSRAQRNYIDAHLLYNDSTAERMYLTPEMGWFAFYSRRTHLAGWQTRMMREEDVEYLFDKVIPTDACFSFNFLPEREQWVPIIDRLLPIIDKYTEARPKIALCAEQRAKLRAKGAEYALCGAETDTPYFLRAQTIYLHSDAYHPALTAENTCGGQLAALRIYALSGAEDDGDAIPLCEIPDRPIGKCRTFSTLRDGEPIDAGEHTAVGFTVRGDGSGAVMRVRLASRVAGCDLGFADYFVRADFVGTRRFQFYQTQNENDPYGVFPSAGIEYRVFTDMQKFYSAYRNPGTFTAITEVTVEVRGESTDLRLSDVRLLKPRQIVYDNPGVVIGGREIRFPCRLESPNAVEVDRDGHAIVTDPFGKILQTLPDCKIPPLPTGESEVRVLFGTDDPAAALDLSLYSVGSEKL